MVMEFTSGVVPEVAARCSHGSPEGVVVTGRLQVGSSEAVTLKGAAYGAPSSSVRLIRATGFARVGEMVAPIAVQGLPASREVTSAVGTGLPNRGFTP